MKLRLITMLFCAAAQICGAISSLAADLTPRPPVVMEATDQDWQRWIVRLRVLGIQSGGSTSISAAGMPVPGAEATISRNLLPELDVSYFLTPNVAASINATASSHKITGAGSAVSHGVLGRMTVLAPAMTLQYHLTDFGSFKPYLGIGGTMAVFINQKDGALNDFKVNHAPGAVFQAGLDWMIGGNWGINVDVKKYILRTTATGFLLGAAPVRSEINSDPWLIGAGLAYRF